MAQLSGNLYHDINGNGIQDIGLDLSLSGWKVFVDYDDDGVLDAGEASATTAPDGAYTITGINSGTYKVRILDSDNNRITYDAMGLPTNPGGWLPSEPLTYDPLKFDRYYIASFSSTGTNLGEINFDDAAIRGLGDNVALTGNNQVWSNLGFRFWLDQNNNFVGDATETIDGKPGGAMFVEQSGNTDTTSGFVNDFKTGPFDIPNRTSSRIFDIENSIRPNLSDPNPAGMLGTYFLRGGGLFTSTTVPTFLIEYTTPTAAAAGWIWDIDTTWEEQSLGLSEKWRVEWFNSSQQFLGSQESPIGESVWVTTSAVTANPSLYPNTTPLDTDTNTDGILDADLYSNWSYNYNSLDGKFWEWSFDRSQADVSYVRITFTGKKKLATDVGFAFDRFQPFDVDKQTADFGVYKLATIGDTLFNDLNANGIQELGDTGVSDATVYLLDTKGSVVGTDTTDANGNYSFDVTPGTYSVKFDLPTGYDGFSLADQGTDDAFDSDVNSAGVTGTYTVKSGEVNNTIDAGVYELATIGDFVFEDKNGDGIQDDGEGGVEGITVTLLDKNGTPILDGTGNPITTTTDADGKYSFEVIPGTYSVKFSDFPAKYNGYVFSPSGKADDTFDSDADTTGITDTVTVTSGETNNDLDAGLFLEPIIPTGSISNFVWKDTNRNGVQDEGEPGVEGVTVNLLDGKGTFITDTTTDSKGFYLFDNLNSGDYIVEFVKPDGYSSFSPIDQGGDDALDSDANVFGQTGIINLSNGENDTSVDAGLLPQLYLGDKVWEDLNGNGIQDNGELGIKDVTVDLLDSNGFTIGTTKTASDGSYKFAVDSGDYSLQFTAPGGYTFTITDAADSNETNDSDAFSGGGTSTVTITTTDNYDIDAGLYLPASIGNFVWLDANKNGIQDNGESGVSNVTVNLLNSAQTKVINSDVTDSDGFYEFTNLAPGTYYVQFKQPSGFNGFTTFQTGGNTKIDSDAGTGGLTGAIELSSGENDNTIDAGLLETPPPPTKYNLGDRVWNDLNQNGIQETNEPGIAGITVNLLNSGGTVIGTTKTDISGIYNFSVDPGTYSVQFAPIATQYGFTLPNVDNKTSNPNDSDSDADPLTGANYGKTETVTITNADNLSLDAGLYIRPTKAEGFTIGYWGKQGIKQGDWGEAGYQTTQNYETVFGVNLSITLKPSADTNNDGTVTLLEALKASGNTNGENLLRQSTAALLNASHPDVDYYYSVGEVITWTQNAFSTTLTTSDDNSLATLFDNANNAGGII